MYSLLRLLVVAVALCIGGGAWAQEPRGWLGADLLDVTKAEADKLGWDTPHGAKVGVVASGSPADKAGLRADDVVLSIDRTEIDTASELHTAIEGKRPGTEIRLRVVSSGHERRISITLGERPTATMVSYTTFQLMLETGGHTALIRALDFTHDGTQMVSVSEDKTMRIWDLQTGAVTRTFRGEIGPGSQGSLNALAVSPDDKFIATGGYRLHEAEGECAFCGDVRIFDVQKGAVTAILKGRSKSIASLAFSGDGRLLVAAHDGGASVWNVAEASLVHTLSLPNISVPVAQFAANDTQIVTGDSSGVIRLWSVTEGAQLKEQRGHSYVTALAISPVDGRIYTGGYSDRMIKEWTPSLEPVRTIFTELGHVQKLAITADGQTLVSSSGAAGEGLIGDPDVIDHKVRIRLFDLKTGQNKEYTRHRNEDIIPGLAISKRSGLVAAGGGIKNEIHIFDPHTLAVKSVLGGSDAGRPVTGVAFSEDGSKIAWSQSVSDPADYSRYYLNRGILEFEITLPGPARRLGALKPLSLGDVFIQGIKRRGGLSVSAYDKQKAGLSNFKVSLARGETFGLEGGIADYTIAPTAELLIVSKHFSDLIAYNFKGTELGRFIGHTDTMLATAISPDERLLITGAFDGTLRLWNVKTRELIASLFATKSGDWVMWTPQGYYTGSPGADKIVGWQINKGREHAADYVRAEQLRQHLNRPDIVEKAIVLASAERAAREAPGTTFQVADLLARPVPRFRIVSPTPGSTERGGRSIVKIAIDTTPDPIKSVRVQVDGRQIEEETPAINSGGFKTGERLLDVPLAKGRNDVRITLTNAIGEKAETVTVLHEGEGALDKRGTLYILAIGVDEYKGLGNTCGKGARESCDLSYSGADARALVAGVEKRLKPGHTNVITRMLINGSGEKNTPTSGNILDAIDLLREAKENDTVVVFIAGHGFNDGPNYRFLATNAERLGEAFRATTVVPWQILQEAVEAAKGRRILFLDTCHSGNAYNQRLGNAAYHANIIAYTAARFDQESVEDPKLGHGLFTYAVVEGLEGKGEMAAKRQISTKELADYVIKRVRELSMPVSGTFSLPIPGGPQEPQYFKGRDAEDYVLARW